MIAAAVRVVVTAAFLLSWLQRSTLKLRPLSLVFLINSARSMHFFFSSSSLFHTRVFFLTLRRGLWHSLDRRVYFCFVCEGISFFFGVFFAHSSCHRRTRWSCLLNRARIFGVCVCVSMCAAATLRTRRSLLLLSLK